MSTNDDANVLLKSTEQINDIMRNKNKFVVTRLNNQHMYSMRKNFIQKRNQESPSKLLQQKIVGMKQNMKSMPLLQTISNNASPTRGEQRYQKANYALQLGTPSYMYSSGLTIQGMLESAGHDMHTKNQQVRVENQLSNSLKKRTFYNCNRGMGLFEPKINQFNPRTQIHRIKLRTNDPLALLLHYTINQSISSQPNKNLNQTVPQIQNSSTLQYHTNQQEKEQQTFLNGVLRESYIKGLNKAVFENKTILQDEQIEKTFLIENPLYDEYLNNKRESQTQQYIFQVCFQLFMYFIHKKQCYLATIKSWETKLYSKKIQS